MTRPDLRPLDVEPVSVRAPYDVRRPAVWDVLAVRADYLTALTNPSWASGSAPTTSACSPGWPAGMCPPSAPSRPCCTAPAPPNLSEALDGGQAAVVDGP
jgi:hypothetical protein